MKVYVAGGFAFKKEVQDLQNKLRAAGHTITHDWTRVEQDERPSPQDLTRYSDLDINGVRQCDVVVALFNDAQYPYRGTFAEIGAAIALNLKIVVVDVMVGIGPIDGPRRVPFFHDGNVQHVDSVEDAVAFLSEQGEWDALGVEGASDASSATSGSDASSESESERDSPVSPPALPRADPRAPFVAR